MTQELCRRNDDDDDGYAVGWFLEFPMLYDHVSVNQNEQETYSTPQLNKKQVEHETDWQTLSTSNIESKTLM